MQETTKAQFHCPRWEELPDIPLYLDQLVMVTQSAIGVFFEDEPAVTKTMINNYVKQKLLEPPDQKKYSREHIAILVVVSLLKRVFSMNEISYFVETMKKRYGEAVAYDMFCDKLESLLHTAFGEEQGSFTLNLQKQGNDEMEMFETVLLALVCKLKIQDHLHEMYEGENKE